MSSIRIIPMLRISRCTDLSTSVTQFHSSSATYLNQYWRSKRKLSRNPNTCGPLITLPDYSFKDNRPTPYGSNQLRRIHKHQEYAQRVIKLIGQIDYAVEKHDKLLKAEEEKKQKILASKLKPKEISLKTRK